MADDNTQSSLMTFPCDYSLKVFGAASKTFESEVLKIIEAEVEKVSQENITIRPSENGKYIVMNITIYVLSKEQLEKIYKALSLSPLVLMTL